MALYKTRYVDQPLMLDTLTPDPAAAAAQVPMCPLEIPGRSIVRVYADALSCSRKTDARAMFRRYKRSMRCLEGRLQAGRAVAGRRQAPWYQNPQRDGHAFAIILALQHAAECRVRLKQRFA
jgi:hypothetical protein